MSWRHVGVDRGPLGHDLHQLGQGAGEVGQQAPLDGAGELGQAGLALRDLDGVGRRGGLDRGAERAALDEAHRQLRLPAELPGLAERARRAPALDQGPPGHAEDGEAVQQPRALPRGRDGAGPAPACDPPA